MKLTREERWIPIAESGERWAPRSKERAEDAMRAYPVGGAWYPGEPWDGIAGIVREERWVSEWEEMDS